MVRHELILTQILAMAQAFVLSFLVLFDLIRIWHVIILSIVPGIINAFDMPTRQSLCLQLCAYPRYFTDICPRQSGRNALYRALMPGFAKDVLHGGPSLLGFLTVFSGGIVCIVGALFFARRLPKLRELVRPIYVKMGIIPEIAIGIQSATELSIHRK